MSFLFSASLSTVAQADTQASTADGSKCGGVGVTLWSKLTVFACNEGIFNHIMIIVMVLAG